LHFRFESAKLIGLGAVLFPQKNPMLGSIGFACTKTYLAD
jgi:hypothetical protein